MGGAWPGEYAEGVVALEPRRPDEDGWTVAEVDEAAFESGQMGPYRLGPTLRRTAWGEVLLALHGEVVVEIDLLDALVSTPLADPDSGLMTDIAAVAALSHRHVLPIVGAGVHEGVPYVVRRHRLGRTLAALLQATTVPGEVGAVILHAVSEGLAYLSEAGPMPAVCALGGVEPRDVYLGYDGSIGLVGLGLRRARGHVDDAHEADLASCFALARQLEHGVEARLPAAIAGVTSFAELSRALRRRHGQAIAHAALHVGSLMRRTFASELADERALMGLPPLQ